MGTDIYSSVMGKKESRIIRGLAEALGLPEDADDFEVLKTAAEALDCDVSDDGTTVTNGEDDDVQEDDDGEGSPQRKRRRSTTSFSGDLEGSVAEEEEEEEDGEVEEEDEEDGEAVEEEEDGDVSEELDEVFRSPVIMEDTRPAGKASNKFEDVESPEAVMEWLLQPMEVDTFMRDVFQYQPAVIHRPKNRMYHGGILSKSDIEDYLKGEPGLRYSLEVDVTRYKEGRGRENSRMQVENEGQVADPSLVLRQFHDEGYSVRILHPQHRSDALWKGMYHLENFWQACVGANAYLTPPGSQGFAPHFDDIDAFVLQLEGTKRWRLYGPTDPRNVLPRYSSIDFSKEDLGPMILETELRPGDILYMPRGCVHEATTSDEHSLHLTLSVNQNRTWQSLFEKGLDRALQLGASKRRAIRASVPRELPLHAGTAPLPHDDEALEDQRSEIRESILNYARSLLHDIVDKYFDMDWCADQAAIDFMLNRLPPPSFRGGKAAVSASKDLTTHSLVQIAYPGASRLLIDADGDVPQAIVVHCLANPRAGHAARPSSHLEGTDEGGLIDDNIRPKGIIEFPIGGVETVAEFLATEIGGVSVGDVHEPESDVELTTLDVARALMDAGLLREVSLPSRRSQ